MWFYLLTGMRKSELLQVKWPDINFTCKEINLEETKAGRAHIITTYLSVLSDIIIYAFLIR